MLVYQRVLTAVFFGGGMFDQSSSLVSISEILNVSCCLLSKRSWRMEQYRSASVGAFLKVFLRGNRFLPSENKK